MFRVHTFRVCSAALIYEEDNANEEVDSMIGEQKAQLTGTDNGGMMVHKFKINENEFEFVAV